jgi:hypothetical protein
MKRRILAKRTYLADGICDQDERCDFEVGAPDYGGLERRNVSFMGVFASHVPLVPTLPVDLTAVHTIGSLRLL